MKFKSIDAKAKKLGYTVKEEQRFYSENTYVTHSIENDKYIMEWTSYIERANPIEIEDLESYITINNKRDPNDITTDYHSSVFPKTLKYAFSFFTDI